MSPCARCRLGSYNKTNNTCSRCDARVLYWRTLDRGIEPPEVDMAAVVFYGEGLNGGKPKTEKRAGSRLRGACGICEFPGCTRRKRSPRSRFCGACYQRIRRRERACVPWDGPPGSGRWKRAKGKAHAHAGHVGFM